MRFFSVLIIALLLVSCKANTSTPSVDTDSAVPLEAIHGKAGCPSENFDGFLSAFIANAELQEAFTVTSVESQTVDPTAEPEPAITTKQIAASELQFPLIPNKQEQAAQGLSLRQSVLDDGNIKVTVGKADTDQQKSYYFKKGACWQLFRIRNESL